MSTVGSGSVGAVLYPNVTSLPSREGKGVTSRAKDPENIRDENGKTEFDRVYSDQLGESDLSQVRAPLKLSAHATQRLEGRKIDPSVMSKVSDAVDRAAAKGIEETLILTADSAFIVSVKNRTVITAMDRNALSGNIFTNIDGAVII